MRAIAHLSRDLDIELVAEGVETHEQLALLVKENVFLIYPDSLRIRENFLAFCG